MALEERSGMSRRSRDLSSSSSANRTDNLLDRVDMGQVRGRVRTDWRGCLGHSSEERKGREMDLHEEGKVPVRDPGEGMFLRKVLVDTEGASEDQGGLHQEEGPFRAHLRQRRTGSYLRLVEEGMLHDGHGHANSEEVVGDLGRGHSHGDSVAVTPGRRMNTN